ncbi:MAG: hypothetical protein GQ531_11330 [Sulfurovum sp.]|nr:hypothetical protein [Sulfurovum sp.]
MSERKPVEIETFLKDLQTHLKEGMSYPDAMQLTAVITGGEVALLVSQAINKYKEATFERTELFQQENVDECALASMGKLWHGENFEGSTEHIDSSKEEIILDALYFILKYAKSQNPLKDALVANEAVCGDKEARKALISQAFDV